MDITSEDTFTLTAATRRMTIKELKKVIRFAIYKANNKKRVETHSVWFGDGHIDDRSRSFHVAITRKLTDEERYWIENLFRDVCEKEHLGCPKRFFKWGVHLKDKKGSFSSSYLFNHDQAVPVKVSPGPKEEI